MNQINIVGQLGADPEIITTSSGKAKTNLRVAVTNPRKADRHDPDKRHTDWFNVTVFGQSAEFAANYLEKGRKVWVSGRMEVERGESKTFYTIIADQLGACDAPRDTPAKPAPAAPAKPATKKKVVEEEEYDPFADE